jgi:hypothetical protein
MASAAIIANGVRFQRGNGATPTEVFTDVPEVFEIIPGAPDSPDIDVTHLLSTARELRAGLPNFGTFTINMNHVEGNTVQEALEDDAGENVTGNYRVVNPNGTDWRQFVLTIATYVTTGYVIDGRLQDTVTFKQSGKPTRSP